MAAPARPRSTSWGPVVFVAIVLAISLYASRDAWDSPDLPTVPMRTMLGTWTDEKGSEGNRVVFRCVRVTLPQGHQVVEGKATFHRQAPGEETRELKWSYGSWEPLLLNLTDGKRGWNVAVKALDRDHLLIRVADSAADLAGQDPFRGGGSRILKRIAPADFDPWAR